MVHKLQLEWVFTLIKYVVNGFLGAKKAIQMFEHKKKNTKKQTETQYFEHDVKIPHQFNWCSMIVHFKFGTMLLRYMMFETLCRVIETRLMFNWPKQSYIRNTWTFLQ